MDNEGSRAAGYVICVVLLVPFILLGLFFVGLLSATVLIPTSAVVAGCALVAWAARRSADRTLD